MLSKIKVNEMKRYVDSQETRVGDFVFSFFGYTAMPIRGW